MADYYRGVAHAHGGTDCYDPQCPVTLSAQQRSRLLSDTAYAETEALLRTIQGEPDRARQILSTMHPYELRSLKRALDLLGEMIAEDLERRAASQPEPHTL